MPKLRVYEAPFSVYGLCDLGPALNLRVIEETGHIGHATGLETGGNAFRDDQAT